MAKLTSSDRRKQVLKERRAELARVQNHEDADFFLRLASQDFRQGNYPSADRLLRKVLILDPDCARALNLLTIIHERANHVAEALSFAQREYKLTGGAGALFNVGILNHRLGRQEKAAEAMQRFLALDESALPAWKHQRETAERVCRTYLAVQEKENSARIEKENGARTAPAAAVPAEPSPATTPEVREAPRVRVEFIAPAAPALGGVGTIEDFFLRRRWLDLRRAQSFEELLCLSSIEGVDSYVYQHETVRRVLRHFKGRALLADEVGLGKTIEACLILKEYWTRGMVRRVLILTPPSLVSQWKGELIEKFGLAAASPDGPEFRRDPEQFWKAQPVIAASIALARLEPHASAMTAAPWDMVIVDEAHCLKNRESANWRLVDSLQKKFILMLTATPVENSLLELYNLITLLKPGLLATEAEFRKQHVSGSRSKAPKNPEQLRSVLGEVMIRNTRAAADVQLPHRIAATVSVEPSETEARIYDLASRFVASRYRRPDGRRASGMALQQLQRQAGSSPVALSRFAARALAEGSWDSAADRRELEEILDLSSTLDGSAKGEQLARMLAAHPGKAVVFTEFLPSLDSLAALCESHGIPFAVFSGDLSRAAKDAAIARFRDQARVLLSTGSGGEGRNLQFADTVINFDLPWNPMRIEQRVGRVHRIGQTHDVFVFNFCQRGALEEQLLRVLHDKINMFELVVGEMDAILGTMDDSRDFAEIVMDLWISGRESGSVEHAFESLAARLIAAKKQHQEVQKLDDSLFARDFEV